MSVLITDCNQLITKWVKVTKKITGDGRREINFDGNVRNMTKAIATVATKVGATMPPVEVEIVSVVATGKVGTEVEEVATTMAVTITAVVDLDSDENGTVRATEVKTRQ